jgi:hypothetical protein
MSTSFPTSSATVSSRTSESPSQGTPDTSIVKEFLAKVSRLEAQTVETIYYNQDYRGFAIHTLSGNTIITEPCPVSEYARFLAGVKHFAQLDETVTTCRQDTRLQITVPQQAIPRTDKHSSRLPLQIAVYVNPTEWGEQLTISTIDPVQVQTIAADHKEYLNSKTHTATQPAPAAHALIKQILQLEATEAYMEYNGNDYKTVIRRGNETLHEETHSPQEYETLTEDLRTLAELDRNPGANPIGGNPTLILFGIPISIHIRLSPAGNTTHTFTIAIPRQTTKIKTVAENLRNTTHPHALTLTHQQDTLIAENNRGHFTINLLETR